MAKSNPKAADTKPKAGFTPPTDEKPKAPAEKPPEEKGPASFPELKELFPKADDNFILSQLEASATTDEAGAAYEALLKATQKQADKEKDESDKKKREQENYNAKEKAALAAKDREAKTKAAAIAEADAGKPVATIVLKRDYMVAGVPQQTGFDLGYVVLDPPADLNFVVAAIETKLAHFDGPRVYLSRAANVGDLQGDKKPQRNHQLAMFRTIESPDVIARLIKIGAAGRVKTK